MTEPEQPSGLRNPAGACAAVGAGDAGRRGARAAARDPAAAGARRTPAAPPARCSWSRWPSSASAWPGCCAGRGPGGPGRRCRWCSSSAGLRARLAGRAGCPLRTRVALRAARPPDRPRWTDARLAASRSSRSRHSVSAMPWPSGSRNVAFHSSISSPRLTIRGRWLNCTPLAARSAKARSTSGTSMCR